MLGLLVGCWHALLLGFMLGAALLLRIDGITVVGPGELSTEHRLRSLTRNLPIVARTDRYVVFDARGGRLSRPQRETARDRRSMNGKA